MNDNPEQNPNPRRLTRSRDDRFIGGVAAGLGQRLNLDPVIIRIAFVISIIFGGLGAVAYLILLATVPVDGDPDDPVPHAEGRRRLWIIGGAIALGALALVAIYTSSFGGWLFAFGHGALIGLVYWAVAIFGVIWARRAARDGDDDSTPGANPDGVSTSEAGPDGGGTPAARAHPADPGSEAVTATMAPAPTQNAPSGPPPGADPIESSPGSDGRSTVGRIMTVFAIVLAAITSAVVLIAISTSSTAIFGAIPMAVVVVALGTGVVIAVLNNRHQLAIWTLGAALVVSIPMAVISIADLRIEGQYGDVFEQPTLAAEIPDDGFDLAAGAMTIDMRDFPFEKGAPVELPLESGLGLTRVIVPDEVCVTGTVKGKAGLAYVRGVQTEGVDFDRTIGSATGDLLQLNLDSSLKLGMIEVIDDTSWHEDFSRNGRGEGPDGRNWDGAWGDEWGDEWGDGFSRNDAANRERADQACLPQGARKDPGTAPGKPEAPAAPTETTKS